MTSNHRITPDNITELKENEIFVFGSNLSGAHGAGAANTALQWGAIYGNPSGIQGQTYAIPTKGKSPFKTLSVEQIKPFVDQFIGYALDNPEKHFLVTEIGCGLAGYEPKDIAPLFRAGIDVENIYLPKKFITILNPFPIIRGYKVTNPDGTAKNGTESIVYEAGREYIHNGPIKICHYGLHFCTKLSHCFFYYDFNPENLVFQVESFGEFQTHDENSKICTDHLRIIQLLTWNEVLEMVNEGKHNTGYSNSGNLNSGNLNSGNVNSGNRNSGNRNSGDRNSGYRNSGDRNSGDLNSGDLNSGNRNSGDLNSGDLNSGNRNSGYLNSGNRNSGAFCTKNMPFNLFNKPSKWTEIEFTQTKAFELAKESVNCIIWVPDTIMTEKEKADYPFYKTFEGYLKTIPYKEAFKNAWHNWNEENRKEFTSLPNFDPIVFEEITGVDVTK